MTIEYDATCPLCRREPLRDQPYEDEISWATWCTTHDVPMVVLARHEASPSEEERGHILEVGRRIFPKVRGWREARSIPQHYHLHAK